MEQSKAEEIIKTLLDLLNVRYQSLEGKEVTESNHTRFLIQTEESAILIGSKGEHLAALNYIARRIASKLSGPDAVNKFFIDVNGYHEKILETLKAKAKVMSERARSFKVDIELEPMSSYERMLVHSFLEGTPDIKTESKGQGVSRRVVIKYISG